MLEFTMFFGQTPTPDGTGAPAPVVSASPGPEPLATPANGPSEGVTGSATPVPAKPDAVPSPLQIPVSGSQMPIPTAPSAAFTPTQTATLALYALICLALIVTITFQTGKSDGMMQQMMGGASPVYKGKRSSDDRLSTAANSFAAAFILMSIIMAFMFK